MALIDLKSNLAYNGETVDNIKNDNQTGFTSLRKQGDETEFVQSTRGVDSQFNENIGTINTTNGNFQPRQEQNVAGQSNLTDLPRPEIDTDTLPPEVKGRQQALQAVEDVGVEKTALFVGKQTLLHKLNTKEGTQDYDPTALAKNLLAPEDNIKGSIGKQLTGGQSNNIDKSGNDIDDYKNTVNPITYTIKASDRFPNLAKLGVKGFETTGITPTERVKGLTNSGNKLIENTASYGLSGNRKMKETELPKDFIKFYIKDVVGNKMIQFPAYLTDITDNSSGEFSPTRYIGRADQVYVYSGYTRNISFGFKVAALNRADVNSMWNKIDDLKGLVLPKYSTDVIQNDNELRPIAPFVELTLGDLFNNQPGYFSSVNVTIPQNSTWEIDNLELSHICDVSVEFTFIGKKIPSLENRQYE